MTRQVCQSCKLRKKKCDKRLPCCSLCARYVRFQLVLWPISGLTEVISSLRILLSASLPGSTDLCSSLLFLFWIMAIYSLFWIVKGFVISAYCKPRRQLNCIYENSGENIQSTELQLLRERLEKVENSINAQSVSIETGSSTSSEASSVGNWINSLLEVSVWDTLVHQTCLSDIHSSVARKARQIVEDCGNSITQSCAIYFEYVHQWMPVISKELFYENLKNAEGSPRADFYLLILCIHLMIQVPAGDSKANQLQNSLYLTTKCLYACLQILLPPSIAGLQAGLLIATFEHASGLCEEAYVTIGACARASSLMRLSRTPRRHAQRGTTDWLRAVEAKNLWWGILIRDRWVKFFWIITPLDSWENREDSLLNSTDLSV